MSDKPLTREELEAQLQKATSDLEEMDQQDKEEAEAIVEKTEEEEETPPSQEEQQEEPQEGESQEEEEDTKSEEEEEPDYEEKFKESAKEGQELAKDKEKIDQAFLEARNLSDPNEEELKKEYADWDLMSDTEKRLAKDNLTFRRRFEIADKADQERKAITDWFNKVDEYIDNPKTLINNPDLEGKQERFKEFAKDKNRQNIPLATLAESFLYQESKSKVKHVGKMFETGKGGEKKISNPNDGKISIEESSRLRDSNYPEYVRLLKAGKIRADIDL